MDRLVPGSKGAILVIAAVILTLAATFGAHGVHAFGNGGHGGRHGDSPGGLKVFMQIDLTDARKTQIRAMLPA